MAQSDPDRLATRLAARLPWPFAQRETADGAAARPRPAMRSRLRALIRAFSRRQLRNNEVALIVLAGFLGFIIGLSVVAVRQIMQWMHEANFAMPADHLLS